MNLKKSTHTALWGSESWEIFAHSADPSVIADGEEKERRLNEIYPNIPLLFKSIDAKTRLSVQEHPNEKTCKVTGGEPKTERDVRVGLKWWGLNGGLSGEWCGGLGALDVRRGGWTSERSCELAG